MSINTLHKGDDDDDDNNNNNNSIQDKNNNKLKEPATTIHWTSQSVAIRKEHIC